MGMGVQEIFFQFGVVKSLIIRKLIRKDFSKDNDLLVNTSFLMSNGLTIVTFSHGRLYHSVGSSWKPLQICHHATLSELQSSQVITQTNLTIPRRVIMWWFQTKIKYWKPLFLITMICAYYCNPKSAKSSGKSLIMLKKFEVDRSLFWCFSRIVLLLKKRHGVLQVKNKCVSSVVLFKEVKQLVRSGLCTDRSLGWMYVQFFGGSERINFHLTKVSGS